MSKQRHKNIDGERCRCTGRCTCEWKSVPSYHERRTRHLRPRNEGLIKRANRRIAEAAEFYGTPLPYKLRSHRSKHYETKNRYSNEIPPVDLINTDTGAVIAQNVDMDYWSGAGTKWNAAPSGRMVERLRTPTYRGTVTRRHNPSPAPLIEWLRAGAIGALPVQPNRAGEERAPVSADTMKVNYRRVDSEILRGRALPVAAIVLVDENGNRVPTAEELEAQKFAAAMEEMWSRIRSGAAK
jgi:hypothetical protein